MDIVKGLTYEAWLDAVDILAWKTLGLSEADLGDWCSMDAFLAGKSPAAGLKLAVKSQ